MQTWTDKKHRTGRNTLGCQKPVPYPYRGYLSLSLFTPQRATLAVNVIGILQNNNLNLANDPELYLYGHFCLDHIDNKRILLATIQYVKGTRRFLT